MCRSIKRLRERDQVASADEVRAAALQFVRKVSGFSKPTAAHAAAFDAAVDEISDSAQRLLAAITRNLAGRSA